MPIFLTKAVHICNQVSCFDIKFVIFASNTNDFFLAFTTKVRPRTNKYMSSLYSFINEEGLVMTRLKDIGRSGNLVL